MFLPERIQSAMPTSMIPKTCSMSMSGRKPCKNAGKYPIHEMGSKTAFMGGKRNANASPARSTRFSRGKFHIHCYCTVIVPPSLAL